jgi:hypothetical protein
MDDKTSLLIQNLLWTINQPKEGSPSLFEKNIYMILDGARNKKIYSRIKEHSRDVYTCLYEGRLPEPLRFAAPYLVELHKDDFTRWLLKEAWGDSWGIFLIANTTISSVRRHLRRFLIVEGPNNKQMYFRYYDPRVFRTYLPSCNPEELDTIFGPIESFILEDEDPKRMIHFTRKDFELESKFIELKF